MTWTKLGDEFADECWTLSDAAFRLHVDGHIWSNRKSCDGRLNKDDMVRWAKRLDAAEELVAKGWWEDHGDHYQIIHHIGYQRTSAQIAHQSEVNRKAANKRWGSRKPRPAQESEGESQCDPHNESHNASLDESESQCESQCEQARTGQDGPRQESSVVTARARATPSERRLNGFDEDECQNCHQALNLGAEAESGQNALWCWNCNVDERLF